MKTDYRQDKIFAAASETALPEWHGFVRYCEWREKGIRAKAFAELDAFLREAVNWPFETRLDFVLWVLRWGCDPLGNSLLSQPLHAKLLVPTVREWNARDPGNAATYLWLGLLRQDDPSVHLEHAIEIDPRCEQARDTLSQWICGDINYHQHELPSYYINDPRIDLDDLDQVVELCMPFMKRPWAVYRRRDAARQRKRARAWLKDHPRPGDFATVGYR